MLSKTDGMDQKRRPHTATLDSRIWRSAHAKCPNEPGRQATFVSRSMAAHKTGSIFGLSFFR